MDIKIPQKLHNFLKLNKESVSKENKIKYNKINKDITTRTTSTKVESLHGEFDYLKNNQHRNDADRWGKKNMGEFMNLQGGYKRKFRNQTNDLSTKGNWQNLLNKSQDSRPKIKVDYKNNPNIKCANPLTPIYSLNNSFDDYHPIKKIASKKKKEFVGSIGDYLNNLPINIKKDNKSNSNKKFQQHEKIFSKEFNDPLKVKSTKLSVDLNDVRKTANVSGVSSSNQKNQYTRFEQNPEDINIKKIKRNYKNGGNCISEANTNDKKGKNIVILTSRNKNNDIFNQQTDLSSPSKTSNKRTYYDNAQNQKFFNKNY